MHESPLVEKRVKTISRIKGDYIAREARRLDGGQLCFSVIPLEEKNEMGFCQRKATWDEVAGHRGAISAQQGWEA